MIKPTLKTKVKTARYHIKELAYTPTLPRTDIKLKYTYHALNASKNDRYGDIPILEYLPSDISIFDITTANMAITHYGLKYSIDDKYDGTVVIAVNGNKYTVVTVWKNLKTDNHSTLNLENYRKTRA